MPGGDGSYVGGGNPLVRLAGMLRRLVAPRWIVSVGTANVEDRRDLLWILADEFVRVVLTTQPQIVNDVVHHDDLNKNRCGDSPWEIANTLWEIANTLNIPRMCREITRLSAIGADGSLTMRTVSHRPIK